MGRAFEYRRASKEKRWDKMSKVFPKLARSITMAAKSSGPDPETNSALRTAISNAKAENMPKDNIDKAIKRASGKDGALYNEVNYEAKGPHGSLLFIETATDNTNRTVANLKMILKVILKVILKGNFEGNFKGNLKGNFEGNVKGNSVR